MAYKIVVTVYFTETVQRTIEWLKYKWPAQSVDKFENKLKSVIERISKNPNTGRKSSKYRDVRSVLVTKHNRIYYQVKENTITLLELFETKQSPLRNRYD